MSPSTPAPKTPSQRSALDSNAATARTVAAGLVSVGVQHVVVSPGSRNTPLVLACHTRPDLTLHVVIDERAAGFVGLGLAKALKCPVALLCTSGSAGTHYFPAVVEACETDIPLIVITADRPAVLHGCGAPQTMPQDNLFSDYARATARLEPSPDETVSAHVLATALSASRWPRPGPVHLNVPLEKPLFEPAHDLTEQYAPLDTADIVTVHPPVGMPAPGAVDELTRRMAGTKRGVILCGPDTVAQCESPEGAKSIEALSELLQWPLLTDAASGMRWDAPTPCTRMSCADVTLRHRATADNLKPDFVLQLGRSMTSQAVRDWLAASDASAVAIQPHGRHLDATRSVDTIISAAPDALAQALYAQLSALPSSVNNSRDDDKAGWLRRWADIEACAAQALLPHSADDAWEGGVAAAVIDAMPSDGNLHIASSMPIRDLDSFVPHQASPRTASGITVSCNRGLNGIDGTVATAAGYAIATQRATVVLCGDLALLHDAGGLLAAANLHIPLVIVVVDNNGGGIFDALPVATMGDKAAFERYFRTPQRADIKGLAAAAGAEVTEHDESEGVALSVRRACAEAAERRAVQLIHISIDAEASRSRRLSTLSKVAAALTQNKEPL